jgi:triacylglycerol lipase
MPALKPRAKPELEFLFHPERDPHYVHFEHAAAHPFDAHAPRLGRKNAWWLADAALLAYWDPAEAIRRFARAGLTAEPIQGGATEGYLAVAPEFVIVAFRGTEADDWHDIFDDLRFFPVAWKQSGAKVHSGFLAAFARVQDDLAARLAKVSPSRPVWFTGHSLGGALATLAADHVEGSQGVCTIGCPRVGDRAFAQAFGARFGPRSLRYVNDADVVTQVPPPFPLFYEHVGELRQIDPQGDVSTDAHRRDFFAEVVGRAAHLAELVSALERRILTAAPDALLDHMPRGYAVDIWNDFARHGD